MSVIVESGDDRVKANAESCVGLANALRRHIADLSEALRLIDEASP